MRSWLDLSQLCWPCAASEQQVLEIEPGLLPTRLCSNHPFTACFFTEKWVRPGHAARGAPPAGARTIGAWSQDATTHARVLLRGFPVCPRARGLRPGDRWFQLGCLVRPRRGPVGKADRDGLRRGRRDREGPPGRDQEGSRLQGEGEAGRGR